jgi:hypothetical protein
MIKELIGWMSNDLTDEEVIALINEIEAEEDAREELADHAMNNDGFHFDKFE